MLTITQKQLQELAFNGFSIEIEKKQITRTYGEVLIGIKFPKKHVYHWFRRAEFEGEEPSSLYLFKHSYCQASGRTRKGIRHGWKIEDQINRALGKLGQ